MDAQTRQEYIRAAISFLQNPKLVDSPLKDKLKFLKDKGLSDVEMDEALNLALVNRHQTQGGKWNFLLILGICVGGYKLYQAYLESKIKGLEGEKQQNATRQKFSPDRTRLQQTIQEETQQQLDKDHPTLNEILQKMSELKKLIELQRSNFGTEMHSLKTLLLGHEKFAAPPKIPEWQLPAAEGDVSNANADATKLSTDNNVVGSKKGSNGKNNNESTDTSKKSTNFIDPRTKLIAPNLE